MKNFNNQF